MPRRDLYLLFRRFGTVLSVHTMVNRRSGLSRGFGFVDRERAAAAAAAVGHMDGFRLGRKRLKVQRKRELVETAKTRGEAVEAQMKKMIMRTMNRMTR